MAESNSPTDIAQILELVAAAGGDGRLSEGAVANLRHWLTEPRYADYSAAIVQHIRDGAWKQLDDVFFTVIPFGTGGRRGMMYPFGSNAINDRTIGESAQGLAEYVRESVGGGTSVPAGGLSCAIAYDTRRNSRHFAELCAGIMAANGFRVCFLDGIHSTPSLSFAVRRKKCSCGIMVTASHNPPTDNAVKVYWSTGGQVLPPHDKAIIDRVMNVGEIPVMPFQQAIDAGLVEFCTSEIDAAFTDAVTSQGFPGERDVRIIYSPLHGVGEGAVCPALAADGFSDVEVYADHREPSSDFPNVPGHIANPENTAVFDRPIEHARATKADVILATDPDCDRLGVAAPIKLGGDAWATFTGNQLCALLCDYVLDRRRSSRTHGARPYVVTTLVTTRLVRRIAASYDVDCEDNLLVGFKWIAGKMDERGPEGFLFGCEESHGYMAGTYARDKDGAVASMLMAELAAQTKRSGRSLHEQLDALYWQHGYHAEDLQNVMLPGSEGMARMTALMKALRDAPPQSLGGMPVARVRDYLSLTQTDAGGKPKTLDGPRGDLVILDLKSDGNYVAIRPSGTEPKAKFYIFTFTPAEQLHDLDAAKSAHAERIAAIRADVQAFVNSIP